MSVSKRWISWLADYLSEFFFLLHHRWRLATQKQFEKHYEWIYYHRVLKFHLKVIQCSWSNNVGLMFETFRAHSINNSKDHNNGFSVYVSNFNHTLKAHHGFVFAKTFSTEILFFVLSQWLQWKIIISLPFDGSRAHISIKLYAIKWMTNSHTTYKWKCNKGVNYRWSLLYYTTFYSI